ncbi:hypothetical protein LTR17_015692 [Elasticomyces elasticus]|nr:hypothetical protein LTR17_015692 [Elasticomyces elasticus]
MSHSPPRKARRHGSLASVPSLDENSDVSDDELFEHPEAELDNGILTTFAIDQSVTSPNPKLDEATNCMRAMTSELEAKDHQIQVLTSALAAAGLENPYHDPSNDTFDPTFVDPSLRTFSTPGSLPATLERADSPEDTITSFTDSAIGADNSFSTDYTSPSPTTASTPGLLPATLDCQTRFLQLVDEPLRTQLTTFFSQAVPELYESEPVPSEQAWPWPHRDDAEDLYQDFTRLVVKLIASMDEFDIDASRFVMPAGSYKCPVMAWYTYPTRGSGAQSFEAIGQSASAPSMQIGSGLFGGFEDVLVCDVVPIRYRIKDVGSSATSLRKILGDLVWSLLIDFYRCVWSRAEAKVALLHGELNQIVYREAFEMDKCVDDGRVEIVKVDGGHIYIEHSGNLARDIVRVVAGFPHPKSLEWSFSVTRERATALDFLRDLLFSIAGRTIPTFGYAQVVSDFGICTGDLSGYVTHLGAAGTPGIVPATLPDRLDSLPFGKRDQRSKTLSAAQKAKNALRQRVRQARQAGKVHLLNAEGYMPDDGCRRNAAAGTPGTLPATLPAEPTEPIRYACGRLKKFNTQAQNDELNRKRRVRRAEKQGKEGLLGENGYLLNRLNRV